MIQKLLRGLWVVSIILWLSGCATAGTQETTSPATLPARATPPTAAVSGTPPPRLLPIQETVPLLAAVPTNNALPSTQTRISYNSVPVNSRLVAMTFDDGPHPSLTPKLLDILKARNIKATFYVIGQNAERYPTIMRRIADEGHEIANHTWSHPNLAKMSDANVRSQLTRTADIIRQTTGQSPTNFRPPYGSITSRQKEWIFREFGYPTIMWAVDPLDWKRPGASVVTQRIVSQATPGAIILAHDIHPGTIDAMPSTLDQLRRNGYQFLTVSQLIRAAAAGH